MTDFLPLILLFTIWVPVAGAIAWAFEHKPRTHEHRAKRPRKASA